MFKMLVLPCQTRVYDVHAFVLVSIVVAELVHTLPLPLLHHPRLPGNPLRSIPHPVLLETLQGTPICHLPNVLVVGAGGKLFVVIAGVSYDLGMA